MIYLGILSVALAVFLVAIAFAVVQPIAAPDGGRRALSRSRALNTHGWLRALDLPMRKLAAVAGDYLPRAWQQSLDHQLLTAGHPLGLCASEVIVLSALCAALGCAVGFAYASTLSDGSLPAWLAVGAFTAAPWLRLHATRQARMRHISRTLPSAIDITALCMNAGLDFTAAIEQLVGQAADPSEPLFQELRHLLRSLSLGTTRAQALQDFADGAPIPSVRDLVGAITQGEKKGTPLCEVLTVQATVLRQLRSVAAEEAASRAGAMLALPLMLLMACIMLIMIAPFAVEGFGL